MKNNTLIKTEGRIYRILAVNGVQVLAIDCLKQTMPVFVNPEIFDCGTTITEQELLEAAGLSEEALSSYDAALAHKRFTMISSILPVLDQPVERSGRIREAAAFYQVSVQTIRQYLCKYLAFQDMRALAPGKVAEQLELSPMQKNFRWALNKYYYTQNKWPLTVAFLHLLKERYTDAEGKLLPDHPTIGQFRYFQRKTEKLQTRIISREGIKKYQRDFRPLLGDNVQAFAPAAGWGMLDATVCDIYLVNDEGQLVGRPILVAAIDAYSGICTGYLLAWEGGTYSLRGLMLNVLEDKVEYCRPFGIEIDEAAWPCKGELPAVLVTDMGSEYTSGTFEQIAELGVTVINLPSFRPELKGYVEQFFCCVQSYYKEKLKGKGVIEPDFEERGAHDYRKDACLTLREFETVLLRCILYYNRQRLVEDFPYTEEMLDLEIKPYANQLYQYGKTLPEANTVPCTKEQLIRTLLPRTEGRFTREGLKVNGLRYRRPKEDHSYNECYLRGGTVQVAYNPDDVSQIWLLQGAEYIPFQLIENRFEGRSAQRVVDLKERQRELVHAEKENNLQAKLDLIDHIEKITSGSEARSGSVSSRNIRDTRQKERGRLHINYANEMKEGAV